MRRPPRTDTRCIYCTRTKPKHAFRCAEHVMPQQIGTYDQNFTLYCVCDDCNATFSRELEDQFARDSIEALDAVQYGLRDASRYRSLGARRSTLRGIVEEGPLAETEVYFTPGAQGTQLLNVEHIEGIRIGSTAAGPWIWRRLDNLPTPDELKELLGEIEGNSAHIWVPPRVDRDKVRQALLAKGYKSADFEPAEDGPTDVQSTKTKLEVVTLIGRPTRRLAAKVAFNYLAYHYGPETALFSAFDAIRDFIRHDKGEAKDFVTVDLEPILDRPYVAGIVVLAEGARAEVSFLGRVRYLITLSRETVQKQMFKGHLFDPFQRKILALARTGAVPMVLYPVQSKST